MAGVTDTGFEKPLQDELAQEFLDDQRANISAKIDGGVETVLGNLNNIYSDKLEQVWEAAEEAFNAYDPRNNTGSRAVATALLTGTPRRPAQRGLVEATVNLDAGKTFAAGDLVATVFDEPGNRWVNRDAVTSAGSGNYQVVFQSETPGALAVASAGTLTVIADGGQDGWNSITNAADATPGQDEESIDALRIRREDRLASSGSSTADAIRAAVLDIEEVIQADVEENTTDEASGGLPAHSFRAIIWDGSPAAADDDEIAQAIYNNSPAGMGAQGSDSGTATTSAGTPQTVPFQRAGVVDVYFSVNIVSAAGVRADDVKEAILARMPNQMGENVLYKVMTSSVFSVAGVDTWATFTMGLTASPTATDDVSVAATQIALSDSSKITVTGDVT